MLGVCLKYEQQNYGSKLQALATVRMIEELGLHFEIIRYKKDMKFYLKSLPRFFNWVFLNDRYDQIQRNIAYKRHPEINQLISIRRAAFDSFDLHFSSWICDQYKNYDELKKKCSQRYDVVLTCSDQLWSPSALGSGFYNLMFAPKEMQKVSWASSFGVNNIPWYQKRRTRNYLNRIQAISMRENRGAEIVRELTGREVPVLMDPVFSFSREQWDEMVPYQKAEWRDYIFCYFLGDDQEHRRAAECLAKKTGRKIVTLRHLDRFVEEDEAFGDYAPYDVDPVRFLNILRNAAFVCTDSFHGMAFSILYEKKFIVFNRYLSGSSNSKNSRIDSVCDNLCLQNRRYSKEADIAKQIQSKIDYTIVNERIEEYSRRTREYLLQSFGNSENQ